MFKNLMTYVLKKVLPLCKIMDTTSFKKSGIEVWPSGTPSLRNTHILQEYKIEKKTTTMNSILVGIETSLNSEVSNQSIVMQGGR